MPIRKCRWLAVALVVPLLTAGPWQTAWALGLSEIEVESALNERFAASIDLLDVGDLQKEEIIVAMASAEDFQRVGVERFFYLTDINFDVTLKGVPKVTLTSRQAISEPYLNFIVEVRWPQGRMLKEFTVLLDPPTFTSAAAPAVAAPRQAAPVAQPSRSTRAADRVALQTPATSSRPRSTPDYNRVEDGEIVTTRDDTLWKIASRTLPSAQVTVNQQMLAIQKLNPGAFMRNNINLLKAGYKLDLPSESEALQLSDAEARQSVQQQTQSWRNPQDTQVAGTAAAETAPLRAQVDATGEAGNAPASNSNPGQGQVRIVASNGDASQGTSAESTEAAAALLETNDTLTRQVDELTYQLDREKEIAANQIALKDRQIEVKNAELAQLQDRMAQLEAQMAEVSQNRNQNQTPKVEAELPWWQSLWFLGGIIGVLVLLLAWTLVSSRRRDDEDDYAEFEPQDIDFTDSPAAAAVEPVVSASAVAQEAFEPADHAELDALEDELANTDLNGPAQETQDEFETDEADTDTDTDADMPTQSVEAASEEAAASGDVIGEADIYVAYGRYGQAVSLLSGALEKDPQRDDIRLKLLEVCVEDEDPERFAEHAQYLVEHSDDEDVLMAVRDLESRLNENVAVLSDLDDVDAGSESDTSDLQDDILALDDLDNVESVETDAEDLTVDEAEADEPAQTLDTDGELALDDFELEFDAEDDVEPVSEASADLGGDLGMDFDPDAESTAADDEFNLDDLEAEPVEPAKEPALAEAAADDDLDDFDFGETADADINATKLDLAEAYIDMGDGDGAKDILREVLEEGTQEQVAKAQKLLGGIAG